MVRQATAEAMEDVLLAEFEKDTLDQVSLKCRYHFAQALMHSLVDRLALADSRLIQTG
jgi:CRP-like cAMP-binding protein